MIVYKWVVKKNNKYYSLRNFGLDTFDKDKNYLPYKIGKVYRTKCYDKFPPLSKYKLDCIKHQRNSLTRFVGYHFWKEKNNEFFNKWNSCLERFKQPKINAILKCEVKEEDVFIQNDYQLVAKKFRILEEQKEII